MCQRDTLQGTPGNFRYWSYGMHAVNTVPPQLLEQIWGPTEAAPQSSLQSRLLRHDCNEELGGEWRGQFRELRGDGVGGTKIAGGKTVESKVIKFHCATLARSRLLVQFRVRYASSSIFNLTHFNFAVNIFSFLYRVADMFVDGF